LRLVGTGYGKDEESKKLRNFFDKGAMPTGSRSSRRSSPTKSGKPRTMNEPG
jgi:hypothetical protein